MRINIVSVGKSHDKQYAAAITDYEQRLNRHVKVSWVFISSSTIEEESVQLLRRFADVTVLLDERGEQLDNVMLASNIERLQNSSVKELTILIGGAFGVSDAVRAKADMVWSLSSLVFPHQLVRLLLIEQLYRTYDTLAGGKYHHS